MGEHINTKKNPQKRHKRGFNESADIGLQRRNRVSFKKYLEELDEELLELELDISDDDDNDLSS